MYPHSCYMRVITHSHIVVFSIFSILALLSSFLFLRFQFYEKPHPLHFFRVLFTWKFLTVFVNVFILLQLQQVLDSFIIFASQQSDSGNIELSPLHSFGAASSIKEPWTQFTPSKIRLAPFPTREYTDDEFQSIIKKVMGVLYVSLQLYILYRSLVKYIIMRNKFYMVSYPQVSFGISLPCLSLDQLFCVREGLVIIMMNIIERNVTMTTLLIS